MFDGSHALLNRGIAHVSGAELADEVRDLLHFGVGAFFNQAGECAEQGLVDDVAAVLGEFQLFRKRYEFAHLIRGLKAKSARILTGSWSFHIMAIPWRRDSMAILEFVKRLVFGMR